jgi:predicted nucleic acid-binding Zn ribbon protein
VESLGALLGRTTQVRPAKADAVLPVPPRAWERAVGTRIAARARPLRLERGILHVIAANSAWAQELSLLAESIAARLREEGLAVTSLRFRVGDVDAPALARPREPPREMPAPVPLPRELRSLVDRIPDEELRVLIEDAASRSLAWDRVRQRERAGAEPSPPPPSVRPRRRRAE